MRQDHIAPRSVLSTEYFLSVVVNGGGPGGRVCFYSLRDAEDAPLARRLCALFNRKYSTLKDRFGRQPRFDYNPASALDEDDAFLVRDEIEKIAEAPRPVNSSCDEDRLNNLLVLGDGHAKNMIASFLFHQAAGWLRKIRRRTADECGDVDMGIYSERPSNPRELTKQRESVMRKHRCERAKLDEKNSPATSKHSGLPAETGIPVGGNLNRYLSERWRQDDKGLMEAYAQSTSSDLLAHCNQMIGCLAGFDTVFLMSPATAEQQSRGLDDKWLAGFNRAHELLCLASVSRKVDLEPFKEFSKSAYAFWTGSVSAKETEDAVKRFYSPCIAALFNLKRALMVEIAEAEHSPSAGFPAIQVGNPDALHADGLDRDEVMRAVKAFRHAVWEYLDSREWVERLSQDSGDMDEHRAATRDACGSRNANAAREAAMTFPIIMRQAELLGFDVASLREAIVRSPWSPEVLRDIEDLVGQIEKYMIQTQAGKGAGKSPGPRGNSNQAKPHGRGARPMTSTQPTVHLAGQGEPCRVLGKEKRPLTDGQRAVVSRLLEAGSDGMSKDALEAVRPSARRILKTLRKDPDWAKVILMPGQTNGRYRLKM